MPNKLTIQYLAAIVVIVFAVGIWLSGDAVQVSWLRYYSAAVTVASIGLLLWEHWIWRWAIVQRIPNVKRSIRGTWEGTLTSYWIDPATGTSPPPKVVYGVIRQTASTARLRLMTDESISGSSLGEISCVNGTWCFNYMYLNEPELQFEERSRIHHGSASYTVAGLPASRITGRYWTDRNSQGEIKFTKRVKQLADDFESARTLLKKPSS